MDQWQGICTQGPFGKIIEVMQQIGWAIQVPVLYDHDGVAWGLTLCDTKSLKRALEDAWMQKIAADVSHRVELHDLRGLDHDILHRARNRLLPSDRGWLVPLQDGTFIEPKQQAKYDLMKKLNCERCGSPDSVAHRVYECPAFAKIREPFQDLIDLGVSVPDSLRLRLLPSRNPHLGPFRRALALQADVDQVGSWHSSDDHVHDLFTDGSCLLPETPSHSLSAYAVVSATHDCIIVEGILGGVTQNSDLAELRALAVEWIAQGTSSAAIWTDSAYVASNLHGMLLHNVLPETYHDECLRIQHALHGMVGTLSCQHVTAHRQDTPTYQDVDEWTAYWNGRADSQADIRISIWRYYMHGEMQELTFGYLMLTAIMMKIYYQTHWR